MSRSVWAVVTLMQTALVLAVVVLLATRGDAVAAGGIGRALANPAEVVAQPTPLATWNWPVTRQDARTIIEAGIARATQLNGRAAIAVIDSGGNLISADRMDGQGPTWDKFALGKATGALSSRRPTRDFVPLIEERPDRYFGTLSMFAGQMYMVPGGQPLVLNGQIVGAIGAAGLGPGEDDQAVDAGIAAWQAARASSGR